MNGVYNALHDIGRGGTSLRDARVVATTDYTAFRDDVIVAKLALITLADTTTSASVHQPKFDRTFAESLRYFKADGTTSALDKRRLGHWEGPESSHGDTKRLLARTRIQTPAAARALLGERAAKSSSGAGIYPSAFLPHIVLIFRLAPRLTDRVPLILSCLAPSYASVVAASSH